MKNAGQAPANEEGRGRMSEYEKATEALATGWRLAVEMKEWVESAPFDNEDVEKAMKSAVERWSTGLTYWNTNRAAALGWKVVIRDD
jgi:hypothetical protein